MASTDTEIQLLLIIYIAYLKDNLKNSIKNPTAETSNVSALYH